jgi:hypothetical protein
MTQPLPTLEVIKELERLAKAATPGPWRAGTHERENIFCASGATIGPERVMLRMNQGFPNYTHDAAFIAAANPQTVLALAAAARSHLELTSALAYIHALGRSACGSDAMTPERILDWARERRWSPTAARAWVKLYKPDGYLAVDEGESYLFAIEVSSNKYPAHWEFFSDAIVWDVETEPQWADGQHGWDLNDEIWFRPCPEPPPKEPGT